MRTAYGTLGWHVGYLQPVIRSVENLDSLTFYYGYSKREDEFREKTLEAKSNMEQICSQCGIKAVPRKLDNIYDFIGIIKKFKADIEKDKKADNEITLFNIAGGTKPMCSAALLVCIFKGIPTQYVNEETEEIIPIPLLKADYLDSLTKKERELAQFLLDNKDTKFTQVTLAKKMKKKKSTINTQIRGLHGKGIIVFEASEDGKSKYIIPSEGIELLFW